VIDHRHHQRFQLRLPVRLLRVGGSALSGEAETVNLGSGGALLTADQRLEVGATLEYTIAFPAQPGSPVSTDLRCLGKVLRYEGTLADSEGQAKLYVMAATIERHEFVRS